MILYILLSQIVFVLYLLCGNNEKRTLAFMNDVYDNYLKSDMKYRKNYDSDNLFRISDVVIFSMRLNYIAWSISIG